MRYNCFIKISPSDWVLQPCLGLLLFLFEILFYLHAITLNILLPLFLYRCYISFVFALTVRKQKTLLRFQRETKSRTQQCTAILAPPSARHRPSHDNDKFKAANLRVLQFHRHHMTNRSYDIDQALTAVGISLHNTYLLSFCLIDIMNSEQ